MVQAPREQDTIYESLRDGLTQKIPELTNFAETSFNFVWTRAFSEEMREEELKIVGAYLSGFVDYSGGPVSEGDLRDLGIENSVTPDELNDYLDDSDLEELVKIVGVSRDPGERATGTVSFTTQSSATTIPEGTSVGTQPDSTGEFFEFTTDSEVTTNNNETTVDANVTAVDVGTEYNVGANSLSYLPNPPGGVQAVTNTEATTGGVDRETNNELRERAKRAIFDSSGGGTVNGLEGFVRSNVEGVDDVSVEEEFTGDSWHGNYPHGHVIVNGGDRGEVLQAIEDARPVSVQHFLVRPDLFEIETTLQLDGSSSINQTAARDEVLRYYSGLDIGDDIIRNKIIQFVLNSDDEVINVSTLSLGVNNETINYDVSVLDNFEDNDISINNRNWGDWSGNTANFSAQSGTNIAGNYSGELASSNESVEVSTTHTSTTERSFEASTRIDTQSGNSSDIVEYRFESSSTVLGSLEFRGNGNVVFSASSDTTVGTWSAGNNYVATVQWDFENDEADVTFDSSTSNNLSLQNSASEWDALYFSNDTTASGSTVNAYTDEIKSIETIYPLGLGQYLVSDGVTEVNGTVNGNPNEFTEDTDYREIDEDGGSDEDSVEWILSGDRPDITTGETETIEYNPKKESYFVNDAMLSESVSSVEDAGGVTYDEGVDWEETDTTNNGRDDGIEWLDGGNTPADGVEFTVTYDVTTPASVDYDIEDSDIDIAADQKVTGGPVNITIL